MKPSVRADAKLQNLPAEALDELWALRHPEVEGDRVWTLTDVAAWVPERFGFSVATSAVANFYQWLALKRRMELASDSARQTRLELLKNKDLSPEDIDRAAQAVFTAETLAEGNVKGYVALAKLTLARRSLDLDSRKLKLLEAKAAQADAASAVMGDGKLTEEEKAHRLKNIFRMG